MSLGFHSVKIFFLSNTVTGCENCLHKHYEENQEDAVFTPLPGQLILIVWRPAALYVVARSALYWPIRAAEKRDIPDPRELKTATEAKTEQ